MAGTALVLRFRVDLECGHRRRRVVGGLDLRRLGATSYTVALMHIMGAKAWAGP